MQPQMFILCCQFCHVFIHIFLMILSCQAPERPEVPEIESDVFSDGAEEGEEELPEAGPA